MSKEVRWPEGKDFAFSIFDDTDRSNLENVKDVYSLLADHGFRTTKSVWPIQGKKHVPAMGSTCEDREYVEWLVRLQESGFEVAYHMSSSSSSARAKTIQGLEKFVKIFGHYPKSMANHVGCLENMYGGTDRLSGFTRYTYDVWRRSRHKQRSLGHVEGNEYFWGDICKEKIRYVRNFVFPKTNTMKMCPMMPYHDPQKPYVNYWFASTDGSKVESFNNRVSEKHQDTLMKEAGACIMYTHFAFGFKDNGKLNSRFKSLIKTLGRKNGWFVPVSTLLDHLLEEKGAQIIRPEERAQLERKWLFYKMLGGTT